MVSLEFDAEANALYVRFAKGKKNRKVSSTTEPLAENVLLDLDGEGKVLGLKVLLPLKMDAAVKAQIAKAA